jgi:ABC-type transport system involved in cytochrome bd biosynthesis fused ATPase/permease subunit
LLQGLYKPSSGHIKIDGEFIENLDINWLRSQMALIEDEPVLFSTSIRENIRLSRLNASDEEVVEIAKLANAHNFIMSLNKQYDTVLDANTQLSHGQKQSIAIARALLRNPKILLLDEASRALDDENEQIVHAALDKARIGRTTIIIAHRLAASKNADLIVGVENGRFKEMGTHDELMNRKGLYYELIKTQEKQDGIVHGKSNVINKKSYERDESSDGSSVALKTWKLQLVDMFWLVLGTIAQFLDGVLFPCKCFLLFYNLGFRFPKRFLIENVAKLV